MQDAIQNYLACEESEISACKENDNQQMSTLR